MRKVLIALLVVWASSAVGADRLEVGPYHLESERYWIPAKMRRADELGDFLWPSLGAPRLTLNFSRRPPERLGERIGTVRLLARERILLSCPGGESCLLGNLWIRVGGEPKLRQKLWQELSRRLKTSSEQTAP